jgi:hypothetical protein
MSRRAMRSTLKVAAAVSLACPLLIAAVPVFARQPTVGDHLRAEPGQPICFDFDDLLEYMIALAKHDKVGTKLPGRCDGMPNNQEYIVTYLIGAPNPGMNVAKIEVRRKSDLLFGWTVIVSGQ